MNAFKKTFGFAIVAIAGLAFGTVAAANPVTMTFDQLNNGEYVHNYYDGGCGEALFSPTCGGPDYGVVWKGAALANNFDGHGNPPSSPNYITRFGLSSNPMTMNVAAGFSDGFSFYYSWAGSFFGSPSVTIYDGLDGTGNVLATTGDLDRSPFTCSGGFGRSNCWTLVDDLTFSGIARSVTFDAIPFIGAGFDNVSFNLDSPTAVPEPGVLGMFGAGLLLIGVFLGLRCRTA